MTGERATAIVDGKLITPFRVIENGGVLIEDGRISAVGSMEKVKIPRNSDVIDASGKIVVPGFIDIHINGGGGRSLMEGTYEAIDEASKFFAKHGTTGFLSTLFGLKEDVLKAARAVKIAMERSTKGAEVLGIHLEGPAFNPKKLGVFLPEWFRPPDINEFEQTMLESGNAVKLVTIAPEVNGAIDFIKAITKRGVVASVGHSYATYSQTLEGIEAGISHATHTFNAMREFHHREPGVVGAVLSSDELTAELVADGFHVHPTAMKILVRCKGVDRVILVTDSVEAAGLPEGEHTWRGRKVIIKGGKCVLPRPPVTSTLAGTPEAEKVTLAGSILTMNVAVKNMIELAEVSLKEAIKMATINPAKRIGVDKRKGSLEIGKDADIAIMDKEFNVCMTLVSGRTVHKRA